MKIYIAGKIGAAGVDAMRINFDVVARVLEWFGWDTVNPCDISGGDTWQSCMIADLHEMLDCDAVYALSNWKLSPGATVEIELALRLGKRVIYESGEVECICADRTNHVDLCGFQEVPA